MLYKGWHGQTCLSVLFTDFELLLNWWAERESNPHLLAEKGF